MGCDRTQKVPEICADERNETFSEWQPMWDEDSKSYYYHNQETEDSQWEVPTTAGCWSARWSAEHNAYFYVHEPTQYSQWTAPQCILDLGPFAHFPASLLLDLGWNTAT